MESFLIVEYIGIISASISGFLFAVRRACDLLGIFIAAFLTALGGGIMRDMLVGRELYSFTHYMPVLLVLGAVLLSAVLGLHKSSRKGLEKSFIFIQSIIRKSIEMILKLISYYRMRVKQI